MPPAWNVKNDGNHNTCKMVKRSSFKKAKVFFCKGAALYPGNVPTYYMRTTKVCKTGTYTILQLNAICKSDESFLLKNAKN